MTDEDNDDLLAERLGEAQRLPLLHVPTTSAAIAFVETLAAEIAAGETRGNQRRGRGMASLRDALGAILGGLLAAIREGRMVWHPQHKRDFSGGWIGHAAYHAAIDGLEKFGLIRRHAGIRFGGSFDDWSGKAERIEGLSSLLDRLAAAGVGADDFAIAWDRVTPPVIRTMAERRSRPEGPTPNGFKAFVSPVNHDDPEGARVLDEVATFNAFMARHTFGQCVPPRFKRVFGDDLVSEGRWYAVGALPYWSMPKDDRLAITIDGAPVCEIDVNASHLRIAAAMAGAPIAKNVDPYVLDGFPREVIKQVVVQTCGNGQPTRKWSQRALEAEPSLAEVDYKAALAAALVAYPFLEELPALLDVPRRRVNGRLTFIEAVAIGGAMRYLMGFDIPALPVFDSLIVPAAVERRAIGGLEGSYGACLGIAGEMIERVTGAAPTWLTNEERSVPLKVTVRRQPETVAA